MPKTRKIGTVEVLRLRVVPLDAKVWPTSATNESSTVAVWPGTYDLWYDEGSDEVFWMLEGKLLRDVFQPIKGIDGAFTVQQGDDPMEDGPTATFPSRRFRGKEFFEFVDDDPLCEEGHPNQRLRIEITDVTFILQTHQ